MKSDQKSRNLLINIRVLLIICFLGSSYLSAQTKAKMTPEVYSLWKKIKNVKISDNGHTAIYTLEREIGDKTLAIYDKGRDTTFYIPRVNKVGMDPSGRYVIYTHSLSYDSLRILKRKKTPKDKLPKDSLSILFVPAMSKVTIENCDNFEIAPEYGDYVLFTKELKVSYQKDSISVQADSTKMDKPDTIQIEAQDLLKTKKSNDKKEVCKNKALFIYHLNSAHIDTIKNVSSYSIAEEAPQLICAQCYGDTTAYYRVLTGKMKDGLWREIGNDFRQVENLSLDKNGQIAAYLTLSQVSKAQQPPYDLRIFNMQDSVAHIISGTNNKLLPQDWVISKDKKLTWSDSSKRLFYGIAPILPVADTTLLEDEIVNVEIWKTDMPRLYTMMEASKEKDRKKTYTVLYDLADQHAVQLETPEADRSLTSNKGDGKYVLQIKTIPYQKSVTWLGDIPSDLYLLDTETGNRMLIASKEWGHPRFSPSGKYLYWWNKQDSIWKTFDTELKLTSILGLWSVSKFADEENDVPDKAGPYGFVGWMEGDSLALIYDRYDIWQLKPGDPFYSYRMTSGRENNEVHRYIRVDDKEDYIHPEKGIFLHVFDEDSKADKYRYLNTTLDTSYVLFSGNYRLTPRLIKARNEDDIIFTKENFEVFPDLIWTDTLFSSFKKISDANPQQKDYAWGKGELIQWKNYNGTINKGMLFYPADFDPEKSYPLIVNFYEKSSDGLLRHRAPEAHRSTINYTYYTNNGYFIFNPDISYGTGHPGQDCFDAVESGVDYLLTTGYIDAERMALQGHSWGGYQVAYLLTKSDRYRCAESGAPVVNMVSAYGGIRWESGLSRMFQYEKTQSRLGVTLWDDPSVYHKNSPLYEMAEVTTPVLILHNDHDGAVPWYQGIEYFMALRRLNKPAWLLNYNDEPHWPVKWQNRLDFNIRMEQFFNYYLKDGTLPLWMKEGNTPLEKGILNKY